MSKELTELEIDISLVMTATHSAVMSPTRKRKAWESLIKSKMREAWENGQRLKELDIRCLKDNNLKEWEQLQQYEKQLFNE